MTVHAPAERPRIFAELARRPGQTAYEVAAALGYGKPASRRVASIIKRMHQDGVLVAEFKRLVLVPRRNPGDGPSAEGSVE